MTVLFFEQRSVDAELFPAGVVKSDRLKLFKNISIDFTRTSNMQGFFFPLNQLV